MVGDIKFQNNEGIMILYDYTNKNNSTYHSKIFLVKWVPQAEHRVLHVFKHGFLHPEVVCSVFQPVIEPGETIGCNTISVSRHDERIQGVRLELE